MDHGGSNVQASLEAIYLRLQLTNRLVFMAFSCFVLIMLSLQPAELVSPVSRMRCELAVQKASCIAPSVARKAPFLGGNPKLGASLRSRPEFAADIFGKLLPALEPTAERMALWSFNDASFRYVGTKLFIEQVFFTKLPYDGFDKGLDRINAGAWSDLAQRLLLEFLSRRASFNAVFDGHDGHRLRLPKHIEVPCVAPNNRFLDHLYVAFALWYDAS